MAPRVVNDSGQGRSSVNQTKNRLDEKKVSAWVDKPVTVRQGEGLDAEKLATFLRQHIPDLKGSAALEVEQFPSGHSNLTYLLRIGERELVLRRPPFGAKIKTAHDMGREYHILSRLAAVYARVPRVLAYCEDESVLGAPFYVMERIKGVILRASAPKGLDLNPAMMRALAENFVSNLVEIHAVDYQAAGLGDLGRPAGYVRRQIEGWTQRYVNARTDDIPDIERVAAWLAEHTPPDADVGGALIHNDYKYDNLVLAPDDVSRIVGVLDWEMATLGDPLMDLGTSLGYWVDPGDPPELQALRFGLTTWPGNLNRRELAQRYALLSGRDVSNILFYYVYALLKIAVIVQQIYARYKAGFTQDERFARLIDAVRVLGQTGMLAIDKGRIDDLTGA
jgi:aminoglycoside phosphotransferase (APT) family kinase protein